MAAIVHHWYKIGSGPVDHRAEDLAGGVQRIVDNYEDALARTGPARDRQLARWEAQRATLLEAAASSA